MERLRHRAEFLAAARGARAPAAAFVLQVRRRADQGPARIGFTVSRKVGTAVERNRVRRRLREMVRAAESGSILPGHDYVVVARRSALTHPFDRLVVDFGHAVRRAIRAEPGAASKGGAKQEHGGPARSRIIA